MKKSKGGTVPSQQVVAREGSSPTWAGKGAVGEVDDFTAPTNTKKNMPLNLLSQDF